MTYNTFSFKVTTTSMWFFKIGSFPTYFTRIPPPPLLLGLGCQPGLREAKTTMSIAISFRSWLLWYFRLSMLPLQLWIHFSRSVEISHATKEKVVGLFMSCLVRAWRCRALMWVFISIQIWSCNYIFTKWCNYIFTRWYRMKCNTKGKSCTTWQDMFGHRLPQNRGPKNLIFSFCWRKLVHHLWTAVPNWIKTDRQTRQACLNPQKRFSFF